MKRKLLARGKMTEGEQECVNLLEDRGLLGKPHAVEQCMKGSLNRTRDRADRVRAELLRLLGQ